MAKARRRPEHNRPRWAELLLQATNLIAEHVELLRSGGADPDYNCYDWDQPPVNHNPGILAGVNVLVVMDDPYGNAAPLVLAQVYCCEDCAQDSTVLPEVKQLKSWNKQTKKHDDIKTVPNVRGNNTKAPFCDHCGGPRRIVHVGGRVLQ